MAVTKKQFQKYVDTAAALADAVKRDITKDGIITNRTILVLNEFIIASNDIADVIDSVRDPNSRLQ